MRSVAAALCAVFLLSVPGCTDAADPADAQVPPAPEPAGPFATIAIVDTGINPYHVDFRDDSPLAWAHPSTYLPGYPADAIALNLTFGAKSLDAALKADKAVWKEVKQDTLYWFPGTKIVGAYATDRMSTQDPVLFSTGHGTMTASRAAGNGYSLCPECRLVAVQGFNAESVTWASEQPWIDVQSNSWSPLGGVQHIEAGGEELAAAFSDAATRHLVFASAGNGVAGKLGVLGHPTFTRSTSGAPGVIAVGGHDNGDIILWSGSWPQVVADACASWAAVGDTLDGYDPREGGGTSAATPYAAGAAGKIVLETRRLVGHAGGIAEGVLANGTVPAAPTPLLEDGSLSVEDAKLILFRTAAERPVGTEHDGESCGMEGAPYNTYPIAWETIPAGTPMYPFIGYGQVSIHSLEAALAVVAGGELPDRPDADAWRARTEALRDAYDG